MQDVELRAQQILAELPEYIWDGARPPIPIEEIADTHFGLHVRDATPEEMRTAPGSPNLAEDETLSGLLLPSLGQIWVNKDEATKWPARRRFTIAHELGHHVLHRTGQQSLFCRRAMVDPDDKPATTRPPLPVSEEEANVFAAALLMPAALIERYYRRNPDFEWLCEVFGSSGAAMGRRLRAVI